jgi:uncharacterized membrane protein YkvA (DUF1232 family)
LSEYSPRYATFFIACVVGYVFSPIDLIPDFIPVLGYVDDLILVPAGIDLAIKMIPPAVLDDCREKAHTATAQKRHKNWVAASVIIVIWFLFASLAILFATKMIKDWDGVLNWWFRWPGRITRSPPPSPLRNLHPNFVPISSSFVLQWGAKK